MYRKLERDREREGGKEKMKMNEQKQENSSKPKRVMVFFSIFISDLKLIGYLYKYICIIEFIWFILDMEYVCSVSFKHEYYR